MGRGIAEVVVEGSLGNRMSLDGCVDKGMVAGAGAVKLLSGLGTDMGTVGDWFGLWGKRDGLGNIDVSVCMIGGKVRMLSKTVGTAS
ncbi:hypothetical protein FCV25MIE_07721 [Fagus crenata]